MLKYLKRQKSRHRSCEIDDAANNKANDDVDFAKNCSRSNGNINNVQQAGVLNANNKRNSLRSTSSFCDEVFFEELASAESEEDAVSCGAGSLRSYASAFGNGSSFNEDFFKFNSRLSMSLPAILNDPICFYYFVQYVETNEGLPLFKFYMNIENFKQAAKSQIDKQHWQSQMKRSKANKINNEHPKDKQLQPQQQQQHQHQHQQHYQPNGYQTGHDNENESKIDCDMSMHSLKLQKSKTITKDKPNPNTNLNSNLNLNLHPNVNANATNNVKHEDDCDDNLPDHANQADAVADQANGDESKAMHNVPELKTLCDLSMRKPITDDEKSQIYAEANKQLTKSSTNHNNNINININNNSSSSRSSSNSNLSHILLNHDIDCYTHSNNNDITINNYNKQLSNDFDSKSLTMPHTNLKHNSERSSQLSLTSSSNESSHLDGSQAVPGTSISAASVGDVIAIYQMFLNAKSFYHVDLPLSILSQISLLVCNKIHLVDQSQGDNEETKVPVDCLDEAQEWASKELELKYLNGFLQSKFYAKYCIRLIEHRIFGIPLQTQRQTQPQPLDSTPPQLTICDVLFSEVALFFLMEYLEQHNERECLDFWTAAINFRKSYTSLSSASAFDENEAQADAMIIYEKFFSLQAESRLWSSQRLRTWVEERICASGQVIYCFDLPLQVVAQYLERKYLDDFLKSQLFENYFNEMKAKAQDDEQLSNEQKRNSLSRIETNINKVTNGCNGNKKSNTKTNTNTNTNTKAVFNKQSLRRALSSPSNQNKHRKTLSDCSSENSENYHQNLKISLGLSPVYDKPKAELPASLTMPALSKANAAPLKTCSSSASQAGNLHIDSRQLNNPNLLWQRSYSTEGGLKFGRVNSMGRYERDFDYVDDKQNWSLTAGGNKLKNAMRKLVNLPVDKVQEEIAWQVAEMIVKDVTSITLPNPNTSFPAQAHYQQPLSQ